MTTANHLINALAGNDKDSANTAFESMIQDRLADHLEVRKVELASTILDDLEEAFKYKASPARYRSRYFMNIKNDGKAIGTVMEPLGGDENSWGFVHHKTNTNKRGFKSAAAAHAALQAHHKAVHEATSAGRQYTRQVAAMMAGSPTKDGPARSIHRGELKAHASKLIKKLGPDMVQHHADTIKGARVGAKIRAKVDAMKEETLEEGGPTRKHFQQVADLLKSIPDEAKRKELAQHHAGLFKQQNPRFDHKRFFAAAGVNEDTQLDEVLSGGSKVASNAQLGKNVMANIRRATQALNLRGVNPTVAAQGHKDFAKLVAKHPKAPGYMLLRKLAPNKAQAVQSLTQAGVPLGGALDAHPSEFNQVIQRIKRFK